MITLGIDIGSSSIKVSLFNALVGKSIDNAVYPSDEMEIASKQPEWAEQNPDVWMQNFLEALSMIRERHPQEIRQVEAIGITYQMHGLVVVDKEGIPLRDSIIWCDSRAVKTGKSAFEAIGSEYCLDHLLNSPGNFTASKLGWVKSNEPECYDKIHKFMLPGDYIAYRLSDKIVTTPSGLSEGIFWDYKTNQVSQDIMNHFGFNKDLIPEITDTFSIQGRLTSEMAELTGLLEGTPITYRAGDQPNNAFSLKVLNPGEIAATAGTSGVIYGISGTRNYDPLSRVNTFLHVNETVETPRYGILFCLNSVGILNSWARHNLMSKETSYPEMNEIAASIPEGSDGLLILPFGNGAERMLENKNIGASIHGLNLITHNKGHILRAVQESIAFAFNYGIELMQPLGLDLKVIRAGKANMFLSQVFVQTLANLSGANIELYETNGADGAARGAAIGAGYFATPEEAFNNFKVHQTILPDPNSKISCFYEKWKDLLNKSL